MPIIVHAFLLHLDVTLQIVHSVAQAHGPHRCLAYLEFLLALWLLRLWLRLVEGLEGGRRFVMGVVVVAWLVAAGFGLNAGQEVSSCNFFFNILFKMPLRLTLRPAAPMLLLWRPGEIVCN